MTSRISVLIVFIFVAGDGSCNQEKREKRPNLDSRFFDINGIINHLFPGLGQGTQGGSYDVPGGVPYPTDNQFYPGMTVQGPSNQQPINNWPIIDDASQYPSKGHNNGNPQQALTPPQNGFNPEQTQYPNQGDMGYPQQTQHPNHGSIANPQQRPITNPGNNDQYPDEGNFNQFPNQGQFPGKPRPSYPNQETSPLYPDGSNFDSPNQYPQGNPQQNQFPGEELGKRPGNDGTLYSVLPPDQLDIGDPSDSQAGNDRNPTAILGRPVIIPPVNNPDGKIFFPNITESPAQRQCVQDCQSTTEYNPVCGSNNITYFNAGKFVCARNCGINVFVSRRGRCPGDTPFPRNLARV